MMYKVLKENDIENKPHILFIGDGQNLYKMH